jgi:DNA polymerase-3 subunit delta
LHNKNRYLTYPELEKEILSGKIEQVYYIAADDNYFLNKTGRLLLKKISGSENNKENFFVKYADELSYEEFIDLSTNFSSLFSAQKIIIVRRCEKFGRKLEDVLNYSYSPDPDTTLILAFNKDYVEEKKLNKNLTFYDFTELSENAYLKWVKNEFASKGCTISDEIINLFISLVPMNFDLAANEMDKISTYLEGENKVVTKDILLKMIGYETEYTPYDLMSAIIQKDIHRAMQVLDYILNRGSVNEVYLLSLISTYLMDLMAYHNENLQNKNHGEMFRDYKLWGDRIIFVKNHQNYGKNRNYEIAFERILNTDQSLKNSMLDSKALITSLVEDLMNI